MVRAAAAVFAVSASLAASAAVPAVAGADGERCCFFLTADSNSKAAETFTGDTVKGKEEGIVIWKLVGIFKYTERGGFADLEHIGPAHEHGIRYTDDKIRSYSALQEPPDTVGRPVADPGTCGVFKRKQVERTPHVYLFRDNVDINTEAYEDPGCMYGISMINWDVHAEGSYAPWGDEFRAPPRDFFRHSHGKYRKATGFRSNYSPSHDYGIDAEYDHTGFMTIEWFPKRALQNRLDQIHAYHQGYKFGDACSDVPDLCNP